MFILLAPAIGQVVIAYLDWRWLFGVLLVQASLTALWFFSIQTETLRPEHRRPLSFRGIFETFGAVLGNRFCMAYALALSLMFGAFVSYLATTQQVLGEIYGLGALLPVAFGALAVVNGLAALANARAVNRIGARALSHGALVISGAAGLIGAAAFAALWDGVPPLWLHLVWISIPVCAFATLFGNLSAIALEPMGARAGAASAVVSAFGSGAGVLVASASGAMFDGTVVPLHLTFGLAGILGYVAVRLSGKPA